MENTLSTLKVRLFGKEEITYGEKSVLSGKNTLTKGTKLLLILLYAGEKGITRAKLLEDLYGREERLDTANNLRVLIHRLKKSFTEAGLPDYEYIIKKSGVYKWNSPMQVQIDALEMEEMIQTAREKSGAEKISNLEKACRMYTGNFMQSLSGDEWVIYEAMKYKKMYTDALRQVCQWKMEHDEYETVIELCGGASELYPYDEWQSFTIESYIAMGKYKEAFLEYDHTVNLLVEELGVEPSEKMLDQFRRISAHVSGHPSRIEDIQRKLQEKSREKGAFFCSLPGFQDVYRVSSRWMERTGQSVFLLVCTLTDYQGLPLEKSEKRELMSRVLYEAIKNSLRRSDSFTKYNQVQYLVMLMGTNEEDCQIVIDRITRCFSVNHPSWEKSLQCNVASVLNEELFDDYI